MPEAMLQRPQVRQLGRGAIIVRSPRAGKGMLLIGIDVDGDQWVPGKGGVDLGLCRRVAELVLASDMEQQWAADMVRLIESRVDPDPVIADGAIKVLARGQ